MAMLGLILNGLMLLAADPKPGAAPKGPLSPREELATFKVPKGFKVELVASEPDVIDPVAMAFDEDGRLFIAEMIGYPNGGVATGNITSGRIRMLEDPDGKGVYSKSSIFADGLRLPASVMPYKGGLLVSNAPDLVYFEGPDANGKAKGKRVLYTGFDLSNSEQLLSSLQWGLDNWVYACAGGAGGTISSAEKPDAPKVVLRGRGIRFRPDVPGSLEPMSGGGQYGLAADDGQHWFTATNSQHLRQIILPDHYLRRNPHLAVPAVTSDIPDHGAACKVFRLSPFEAWRVERTEGRVKGTIPGPTEQGVPGGYITSGCSPVIYNGGLFPPSFHCNSFMCEPANNLIHRDVLVEKGSIFVAKRADEEKDCDFFASTDIWFRPVWLTVGPDGAMYVADFYREIIETPLSLPDNIKKKYNLETRGKGRIWRVVPENFKQPKKPALSKAKSDELVVHLKNPNAWWRMTTQRLIVERQDKKVLPALEKMANGDSAIGRVHALWTLHGLKALSDKLLADALRDDDPEVCEQALRLAEGRLASSAMLRVAAVALAEHIKPRVRFQAAFSLGESDAPEAAAALAKIAVRDAGDVWTQSAVLSSASKSASGMLENLVRNPDFTRDAGTAQRQLIARLASLVGARAADADLARALALLGDNKAGSETIRLAVLEGLGLGLQNSGRPLRKLWEDPPAGLKEAVARTQPFFQRAAAAARDDKRPLPERLAAVRLLGIGPFSTGSAPLQELLNPLHPADIQLAAVRALSVQDHPKVSDMLLSGWNGYSPSLRREVTEAMVSRADRVRALLDAIDKKTVLPAQIEAARVEQLRKHPNAELRKRAETLFAGRATPDRQKVVDDYKSALDLKADTGRGKAIFKKTCAVCHRLENEGIEVGPDLLSALKTKTRDGLVIDILDPSREVDPRYINYVVSTKNGRVLTGMIAVESPASITLRRAEKAEDVILRNQIEEIQATSKSLMPDELEKQLSKQDLADVIEYLLAVARK
jgi:putative membrane-bound dehydrogenase-like protein